MVVTVVYQFQAVVNLIGGKTVMDPKESPVLRFLEKPWTEEETPVRHLDSATFQNTLRKIKHAIIMSHPPWCGYWSVKPGFVRAAENLADDLMIAFGAADCTLNQIKLHDNYDLQGCSTVNHFRYMDKNIKDTGGRKVASFIPFVHNQARTYTTLSNEFTTQNTGFNDEVTIASDVDFERVIASPAPTFIMFYSPSCATCTQLKPDVNRLAVKLRQVESPVAVCAVNATENPRVADIVGITTLPLYNMYSNGNLIATYTGDRTSADMFEFCLIHHTVKIDS